MEEYAPSIEVYSIDEAFLDLRGITNMYLAKKPDGSAKYTLAERMSVSGHKTESQYIKYIKCSLDEVAEMVAAANDKDGDNLF